MNIHTLSVHAGERLAATQPADGAASFRPVVTPVYHSVGYTYEETADLDAVFAGTSTNPVYTRYGNPTVAALETALAALEGGEAALAYGSGMAAIPAALLGAGARAGTTVVAAHDVYGATYALLVRLLATQGVSVRFVDAADHAAVAAALADATAAGAAPVALLVETISNPLLKVADLPRLADLAHAQGAAFIVDNTFATPVLCRPLEMGADYVVHSATKYLGGHGDVLGGAVITSAARRKDLYEINKLLGANLGPQDAWLVHRGLKTLPLRVTRQCTNATEIAGWLAGHRRVAAVNYPGLAAHPQHDLATRFLGGSYGAMVSFDLAGAGQPEVFSFMEALRLIQPATTLGDVYTLMLYPAMSSHRALDAETRARIGIGDGLVRLSVGIEDAGDIIADLEQALAQI
jgi:cystathionine beta-lyase/cystathionine gamma-synthase